MPRWAAMLTFLSSIFAKENSPFQVIPASRAWWIDGKLHKSQSNMISCSSMLHIHGAWRWPIISCKYHVMFWELTSLNCTSLGTEYLFVFIHVHIATTLLNHQDLHLDMQDPLHLDIKMKVVVTSYNRKGNSWSVPVKRWVNNKQCPHNNIKQSFWESRTSVRKSGFRGSKALPRQRWLRMRRQKRLKPRALPK